MFNVIKNFFPLEAKSIQEFAELVGTEPCCTIVADPHAQVADATSAVRHSRVQYLLTFTAKTARGRKITCTEFLFDRVCNQRDAEDALDRRKANIRLFLCAQQKVQLLLALRPGASVYFLGPNRQPMNNKTFDTLRRDAALSGVLV
jgi:hypothetical protein